MTDWMKQVHKKVADQLEKYEKRKYTLTDDEIEKVMPKVIEFYNDHPEDEDVYRDENGIILLIQTPKAIRDRNDKLLNSPQTWDAEDTPQEQKTYLINNCKFRHYGHTESISVWGKMEQWKQIEGIYDQKAFIKASKLNARYKMIGSDDKPTYLSKFLEANEVDSLDELDESEYIVYYSINIAQVIV